MTKTRYAILSTLKVGGLLSVALIAPNVASLLGRRILRSEKEKTRSSLNGLVAKGFAVRRTGGYEITPKGRATLDRHLLSPTKPERWDGKWRVVIFDIPEGRKAYRDVLRLSLKRIGFLKFQHSAWVYPHDCEELVALLKAEYRLGKEVSYLIVDAMEHDRSFRNHFKVEKR